MQISYPVRERRSKQDPWLLHAMITIVMFALVGSLSGCTDTGGSVDDDEELEEEVEESAPARRTPRTFYGQSVGKAKDLTRSLNSRDQGMFRQADELGDD